MYLQRARCSTSFICRLFDKLVVLGLFAVYVRFMCDSLLSSLLFFVLFYPSLGQHRSICARQHYSCLLVHMRSAFQWPNTVDLTSQLLRKRDANLLGRSISTFNSHKVRPSPIHSTVRLPFALGRLALKLVVWSGSGLANP